jgi:competence protein ComEC
MRGQQLLFLNSLLLAVLAGIYAAHKIQVSESFLCAALFILLLCAFFAVRKGKKESTAIIFVLFFLLGFMRFVQTDAILINDISRYAGTDALVKGVIEEAPQLRTDDEGHFHLRYTVKVKSLSIEDKTWMVTGRLYVHQSSQDKQELGQIGDGILSFGTIKNLHGYKNPGRVDTVASAKKEGITASLSVGKKMLEIRPNDTAHFMRWIQSVREKILLSLQQVMSHGDAAAIFAMLFGGYEGIRPELLSAFTVTGIVHILSVSGSHISLLAGTTAWFCSLFRVPRLLSACFVTGVIVIYSIFAGAVPPVIRAAIMGILAFFALALGREQDARRILTIVAGGLLLYAPGLLYDISFQLSFAATAGLIYIAPMLRQKFSFLPEALAGNLSITIGAQLSVLPILAWYFNVVSLSSLLANFLVVPILEYIIILGLAAVCVGMALPFLQPLLFVSCSLALGLVYELTRGIAKIPGGQIYLPSIGLYGIAFYYVCIGIGLLGKGRAFYDKLLRVSRVYIIATGCILCIGLYFLWPQPKLQVHFIDVGQGDAALLITPHGKGVMIDTGGVLTGDFDIGARVDLPYLYHYGVQNLEYLILTHAHADHAGGAGSLIRKIPVKHVIIGRENRIEYEKTTHLNLAIEPAASFIPAEKEMKFIVDGVLFSVLHVGDIVGSKPGNEASNVVKVMYGSSSFLFTGDLTAKEEKRLLDEAAPIKSTVLKVGHHGSKTSSTKEFINAVQPVWAVISVGADNPFGHPGKETLERLQRAGAHILRTDQDGAIVFESDGNKMSVHTYVEEQ